MKNSLVWLIGACFNIVACAATHDSIFGTVGIACAILVFAFKCEEYWEKGEEKKK